MEEATRMTISTLKTAVGLKRNPETQKKFTEFVAKDTSLFQ